MPKINSMIWNIWYESDDVTYSAQYMFSPIHNRFVKKKYCNVIRIVIMQSLRITVGYCYVFYASQLPCTKLEINTHKHSVRLKHVDNIVLTVPDHRPNSQLGFCFCQHGFLSSSSGWRFNLKEQNKQVLRALYLSPLVASNLPQKCNTCMVK